MIPSVINLRIKSGSRFKMRLWLPVFLFWPVFIALFLALLPFLVIVDFALLTRGIRIRLFSVIAGVVSVLSAMHGTIVRVNSPKSGSIVHVTIH